MEPVSLTTNDLCHHVVTFGMDIYPPVDLPNEQTRLNMFFEDAKRERGDLFDQLITSSTEFRISKRFRKTFPNRRELEGPAYPFDTFVLTNRGPVFAFPLILDDPVGTTGLEQTCAEDFTLLRRLFFKHIPNRSVMRLGLIRDLLFLTGETRCEQFITEQAAFAGAGLFGGQLVFKYRDAKYNHNFLIEPVSRMKVTQLPVGAVASEPAGYGVRVRLDVNNFDMQRPLEEPDIQGLLERATSLWPDELLKYLNELFERRRS